MIFQKIKEFKQYLIVFFVTLLVILFVRIFFVQPYTVSSSQMETALLEGDRVFVNKLAYGARMPITLISLPFSFDKFWGLKSYSDLIQLDYCRPFSSKVMYKDIVLFNNPLETHKPIDKRGLVLSRCVATAGDTILVEKGDFFVNGEKYIPSPDLLTSFRFKTEKRDSIFAVMDLFNIPIRNVREDSLWNYISLNRHDMFILNQKLSQESQLEVDEHIVTGEYSLIVPFSGQTIVLTPFNVDVYGSLILAELGTDNVKIENHQLIDNDTALDKYTFKNDYYWFISDNEEESLDSRYLGFISEEYIIGRVSFIWFSSGEKGARWSRVFSSVK